METGKAGSRLALAAAAAAGGLATGALVFGWLQFGESIYLTRLATFVASCF
ncbi:MAG: hypothetical protein BroJett030_22880 [Alphaproteobacteria bacterium]|nr:MAG: hypothetical protein BroJett030_22880 [Alphaproteobacteria bacterium]